MVDFSDWFSEDYTPNLASGYTPQSGDFTSAAASKALKKRPDFAKQTRLAMEGAHGFPAFDPDNKPYLAINCKSCGYPGAVGEMQLGHKTNWREFAKEYGPRCPGAVRAAFNDLSNLDWEHSVCNVSHMFEGLSEEDIDNFINFGFEGLSEDAQSYLQGKAQRSGAFTDDPDDLQRQLATTAEMFKALQSRHTPSQDDLNSLDIQTGLALGGGRVLEVVMPVPSDISASGQLIEIAKMKRPKWKPETYSAIYADWNQKGRVKQAAGIEFYSCGSCGNWGEGHAMQLGHGTDWREHIKDKAGIEDDDGIWWADSLHAELAYADLNNLKYEHQSCNVSHDWEELKELGLMGPDYNPYEAIEERIRGVIAVLAETSGEEADKFELRLSEGQKLKTAQVSYAHEKAELHELSTDLAESQIDILDNGADPACVDKLYEYYEGYLENALISLGKCQDHLIAAKAALAENEIANFDGFLEAAGTDFEEAKQQRFNANGLRERAFGVFNQLGQQSSTPADREESNRTLINAPQTGFLVSYFASATPELFERSRQRALREEDAMVEIMSAGA